MLKKACREIRDLVSPQDTATPPNLLPSPLEQDFRAHNAIFVSRSRRCEARDQKILSANMAEARHQRGVRKKGCLSAISSNQTGLPARHQWLQTNEDGRASIRTLRPTRRNSERDYQYFERVVSFLVCNSVRRFAAHAVMK